jgi:hypothetical protein
MVDSFEKQKRPRGRPKKKEVEPVKKVEPERNFGKIGLNKSAGLDTLFDKPIPFLNKEDVIKVKKYIIVDVGRVSYTCDNPACPEGHFSVESKKVPKCCPLCEGKNIALSTIEFTEDKMHEI